MNEISLMKIPQGFKIKSKSDIERNDKEKLKHQIELKRGKT